MSTVTVCDRCGKQDAGRGWMQVRVTRHRPTEMPTIHDLCGACAADLDRWLRESDREA